MKTSSLEQDFIDILKANKLNRYFKREYRFHDTRKWRFDFADPVSRVAVECEGGVWGGGRHTTGAGFTKDCEKYNEAVAMGWRVLRYTTKKAMQSFPEHYRRATNAPDV